MKELNLLMFIHETDFMDMPSIFADKVDNATYNLLRRELYEFTNDYASDVQRWVYFILNLSPKLQEILLDHASDKNPTEKKVDVYRKSKPIIQRVSEKRVYTLLKTLKEDPDNFLLVFSDD